LFAASWEDLVEIGVSTGASIERDPRVLCAGGSQRAITERILERADEAGFTAALIDADPKTPENPKIPENPKTPKTLQPPQKTQPPQNPRPHGNPQVPQFPENTVTTWLQFAHTVRAAARGLGRRGLRDNDTVGIFVQDAASHAVASHAVRAAGAIALPLHPAADIAAQLKACRARLLITSAALAELAIQAAERSWVRQVFAFGEAAGTTPFSSLLEAAKHGQPPGNGTARTVPGSCARIPALAGLIPADRSGSWLTHRDVVVAGPPCGDPDAYSLLLDLALVAGATIVAAPLPQITAAISAYQATAAIVPRGTHVPAIPAERIFTVA
jgi:acyl-CoA synthetase (AMP-forming)/AMP-acid ligase II